MPARASLALIVTVVGLFLLFNFKTPDIATTRPNIVVATSANPAATASAASGTPTSSGPAPTPNPTATPGLRDGTFTGQDFPNQFGDVQVAVVLSGGRITDVVAKQLPNDRPRSASISQQAGPWLHDQVLQVQSAQIDGVSGATYTSQSYAQSVQSALDQARS